jgi:uncharacterized protein YqjF (DUF2071 family)
MTQTWHHLLFAHWPTDPETLRAYVPPSFEIEVCAGSAWLGIVPFDMTGVRPRGGPPVPGLSAFPELNVRTYVRVDDKPGVYFFSLDAGSSFAVAAARLIGLPYFRARLDVRQDVDGVHFHSRRLVSRVEAALDVLYRPDAPAFQAVAGTLEHFLTERYCLYALDPMGHPYRLEIHHPPWELQAAVATFHRNSMAAAAGLALADEPPLLHYVVQQRMVAWLPRWLR